MQLLSTFFLLDDLETPNNYLSIVAVHGLAANPDYAWVWQPKNNPPGHPEYPAKHFNWLKELLPIELSSAQLSCRVMTFNYDSKWFMNAPQQRLSNISDTLLVSLRNKRDKQATGRPLIFIGHSFGGNLIEQAIISASRQSGYLEIAESTVGVVFLGTPHRGSAAASWGVLITSLAPPQFTAEKRILKDLEEQSSSLTDRLHDFSRWLFVESVPVVCFFEQLATDYSSRMGAMGQVIPYKELVVPETSACIDGHPKISLHADHFKINKFYGPDDPSFKLVYPEIERMARGAQDILNHHRNPKAIPMDQSATSGDLRTCLQEMRVTNPRDILSEIWSQKGKRIRHTCEWILKREEFSAWGANDNSQLLRLIGSPGIGKTMMSTFLIEVLKGKVEKSPDKMFAYFLCDYRYPEQRSPTAVLRSLIWQLLLQRNGLFQHMQSDFEKHKDSRLFECLFENFSALWRIFQDMLQDEHVGEVFILIDALDECDRSTRKALLRCIRELFQASPESEGNFKFLVTCRPEIDDIEFELDGIGVALKMDSGEVNADLSDYINLKSEDLAQRKKYSQSLGAKVKKALVGEAGGTFLWVSLMINELGSIPNYEVERKLKDLPKGLDEAYTRILEDNIPKERQEDARFLLLSMISARRPLKKKEIAASFAFWKTSLVVSDQDLHDYMDICASCSSIIFFDVASNDGETTVNFCHQSFKDFLLKTHSGISGAWYQTSSDGANLHMFQLCWRYLSSDVFFNGRLVVSCRNNMLHKTPWKELQAHSHQYSFLGYASREWEEHAITSYPAILKDLQIDTAKAPTLRDAWLLRTAREGQGQEAVVKLLLATEGVGVDSKDEYGKTPLSLAATFGNEATVKLLLETEKVDVDSKDETGRTPLFLAAEDGHEGTVKLLLETEKVDVNSKDKDGWTPLLWAAAFGLEAIVKLLLAIESIDVDTKDEDGLTPLSFAAANGHEAIVKLLLETEKVDVDSKDGHGRTPLSRAAGEGHEGIVKLLLKNTSANTEDTIGRTPFSFAAINGHDTVARAILSHESIDLDQKDHYGSTLLSIAVRHCRTEVVKVLLATEQVTFGSQDCFGRTLWWWARRYGNTDIKQALHGYAEKRGIAVCENDEPIAMSPISHGEASRWCDVCTLSIPENEVFYECGVCNSGDFDVCSTCYMIGGRCLGDDHELAQRKDKKE
ncbi:Vegetative incompatibility protein HET-E-1 [Fusarium oxysporum f. sp. conglutinans]|nr:Vegetative incompatibility protein HET-E-1 [Fusarium oxysporum f. sp. conglutinans]